MTVEFAIALPVLLMFTFASVEFSRVNMVRNTAVNAAYEGARRGIVPGATADECAAAARQLLQICEIGGGSVSVSPDPLLPHSESVTVTVTVPITAANSFVTPQFYLGKTVATEVTLPREQKL